MAGKQVLALDDEILRREKAKVGIEARGQPALARTEPEAPRGILSKQGGKLLPG